MVAIARQCIRSRGLLPVVALLAVLCLPGSLRADTLETQSGAVVEGKIVSRDDKSVVIEITSGGRTLQRRYPLHMIKALTVGGKRERVGVPSGTVQTPPAGTYVQRTRQEVDALIDRVGRTEPEWLASVQLNLPRSLDLSWPARPAGGWDNQRNIGQFIWDVVNPNPGRWKEGLKLMYHLGQMHRNDGDRSDRSAREIASMYHRFFLDWARSAWWWRKVSPRLRDEVALAECYWRLGCKAMAADLLTRQDGVTIHAIKLWADMGETDKALKLTELFAGDAWAAEAYMTAGDACRLAGRCREAAQYYQKAAAVPNTPRNQRTKNRARASLEAIQLFDTLDLSRVPDGTYSDSSLGYEAPVTVEVQVVSGKITSLKVVQHREKQFYSALTDTPEQILRKQSVKGIDAVTGATITCEAILNATAKALHRASQIRK